MKRKHGLTPMERVERYRVVSVILRAYGVSRGKHTSFSKATKEKKGTLT